METVEQRVHRTIQEILNVSLHDIKPSSHLVNDFAADSLDEVELAMALEDEFEIEIPDEDAAQHLVVGDIVTYIQGRLASK